MEKNVDLLMEDRISFRLALANPLEKESAMDFGGEDAVSMEFVVNSDMLGWNGILGHA
jgi:hypothetical protein